MNEKIPPLLIMSLIGMVILSCGCTTTSQESSAPQTSIPQTGNIEVTAVPQGALVKLNNLHQATTPHTYTQVPIGSHRIDVYLTGYTPFTIWVDVTEGQTNYVNAVLKTPTPTPTPTSPPATSPSRQTSPAYSPSGQSSYYGSGSVPKYSVGTIVTDAGGSHYGWIILAYTPQTDKYTVTQVIYEDNQWKYIFYGPIGSDREFEEQYNPIVVTHQNPASLPTWTF